MAQRYRACASQALRLLGVCCAVLSLLGLVGGSDVTGLGDLQSQGTHHCALREALVDVIEEPQIDLFGGAVSLASEGYCPQTTKELDAVALAPSRSCIYARHSSSTSQFEVNHYSLSFFPLVLFLAFPLSTCFVSEVLFLIWN